MDTADQTLTAIKDAILEKDVMGAIEACERLLATDPSSRDAMFFLGLSALMAGAIPKASDILDLAHRTHPDCREVVLMISALKAATGKVADATYYAKLSLTLADDPDLSEWVPAQLRDPASVFDRMAVPRDFVDASIEHQLGNHREVIAKCEAALHTDSRDARAYALMGKSLGALGKHERAEASLHGAIHLDPTNPEFRMALGEELIAQGRYSEGRILVDDVVADSDDADLAARAVEAERRNPRVTRHSLTGAVRRWNRRFATEQRGQHTGSGGARPAVAYLINQAAVDRWLPVIEAVLAAHKRDRIDVHVLQQFPHDEEASIRLKRHATSWREIYNVDDDTFAFMAQQLRLDVLVDLCGFTPGNRRELLAKGLARTQIGWLNGGIETADDVIDYVVGDAVTEAAFGPERQVILPKGMIRARFTPAPASTPDLPASEHGFVTFGAIGLPAAVVSSAPLWAKVLRAVPQSRLLLGDCAEFDQSTMERFVSVFSNLGLSDRIQVQNPANGRLSSDVFFSQVDVLLDATPVTADLALCEALREGVPVVTLRGASSDGCVGASILATAGRPEWIATDGAGYAAIARDLTADLAALADLRATLRRDIPASDLADAGTLAGSLEAVYLGLPRA